jgi:WD40 repeat protein
MTERWSAGLPEAVAALDWQTDALLVGSADGRLRRFEGDGTPSYTASLHAGGVTRVRLRPDGVCGASAGEDGRVLLWDPTTAAVLHELADESTWIEHLAWSSDGQTLAAAAEKTIYLWRDGESLGVWYDARRRVLAMAWAPDGRRLATASNKGLYLWRVGGHEPVQLLEFPGAPVAVAWDPAGRSLAVGTQDGFLQIWQQGAKAPSRQLTMRGYPGKVACLAWHPAEPLIASAGGPDVVLWSVRGSAAGRKAHPLRGHAHTVTALAYSPDAALLASGDRSGRLCLWDSAGSLVQVLETGGEVLCLAWSRDGSNLACGTTNGHLRLFAVGPPTGGR